MQGISILYTCSVFLSIEFFGFLKKLVKKSNYTGGVRRGKNPPFRLMYGESPLTKSGKYSIIQYRMKPTAKDPEKAESAA